MNSANSTLPPGLDEIVELYEAERLAHGAADIQKYLPDPGQPDYLQIVAELIRVDLEYTWSSGSARSLDTYRDRFSAVFENRDLIAQIAFEEFRQRRRTGESVSREDYAQRYEIDVSAWPSTSVSGAGHHRPPATDIARPDNADVLRSQWQPDLDSGELPRTVPALRPEPSDSSLFESAELQPGGHFAGFEIVRELGRGVSARAYLAQQPSLANRLVVLKVTTEQTFEPDRLARLQHTNIVPIYSFHRVGPLHVICMPFFGSCMLSHWMTRLRALSSPPATGAQIVSTIAIAGSTTWPVPSHPRILAPDSLPHDAPGAGAGEIPRAAAELLNLERASYGNAVLSLVSALAAGLAHAHDHGVLHLDLKPPNILLTDEGRPMLLDFHLAITTGPGGNAGHFVGGTLPYMSPEQLASLQGAQAVDERSDIYSFGVVLFELLTGQLPFPARTGDVDEVVRDMRDDRRAVPRLRDAGSIQISPAVEAIVRCCLQPEPAHRYHSFHELVDDLERQLNHQPLRYARNPSLRERLQKWVHRHPRLMSGGAVSAAGGVLLAVGAIFWQVRESKLENLEARRVFSEFEKHVPEARALLPLPGLDPDELAQESSRARQLLTDYGVLESDNWRSNRLYQALEEPQRQTLERDMGQLLYLLSASATRQAAAISGPGSQSGAGSVDSLELNARALACFPERSVPAALWNQRVELLERAGRTDAAAGARQMLAGTVGSSLIDRELDAVQLVLQANFREAAALLAKLRYELPQDSSIWFLAGNCHFALQQYTDSESCFAVCVALRPDWHRAYYQRGVCRLRLGKFAHAQSDFEFVLKLRPDDPAALVSRALALDGQEHWQDAVTDLTEAIQLGFSETRVYFVRSRIHEKLGDRNSALRDRAEGLRRVPTDPRSWVSRGFARLNDSPDAALADFQAALALNPREYEAYRNIAYVLSERLDRPAEAIRTLDRLLELTQDDPLAWTGRGVLLARLGRQEAARADARRGLELRREPLAIYQAACIEAICAATDAEAVISAAPFLAEAIIQDPSMAAVALSDPDLQRVQSSDLFRNLVAAVQFLETTRAPR